MKKEEKKNEEATRVKGKISFYNEQRGFGFLIREDNNERLFYHCSDLEDDKHNPQQNDIVSFEVAEGREGKEKAIKVKRIEL